MRMAAAVDKLAKTVMGIPLIKLIFLKGKTALAIEAFARALRQLPHIIADNGGYDSAELV